MLSYEHTDCEAMRHKHDSRMESNEDENRLIKSSLWVQAVSHHDDVDKHV